MPRRSVARQPFKDHLREAIDNQKVDSYVTHHDIADHEIARVKGEYIADVIDVEVLERRIEGWLKWEKLPSKLARREFEEKWMADETR